MKRQREEAVADNETNTAAVDSKAEKKEEDVQPQRKADVDEEQKSRSKRPKITKLFKLPSPSELSSSSMRQAVHFSQPLHFASYWKEREGNVRFNAPRPKKYHDAKIESDLSEGFQTFVDKRQDDCASLKLVTKAINKAKYDLKMNQIHFVSYRNNFNKILGTVYDRQKEWSVFVNRKKDIIYLRINHLTPPRSEFSTQQKRFTYWGYKFEDYSTDSAPQTKRKKKEQEGEEEKVLESVVDANEEFCSLMRLRLNLHRIVLAAEIDCCDRSDYSRFIELKTSKVLLNERQNKNFKRYKLLKYWIQSFLAGVSTIVVGFRDENGIIKQIEKYPTLQLPEMVEKWMWNANAILNFADRVLGFLQSHVKEGCHYELSFKHPFTHIRLDPTRTEPEPRSEDDDQELESEL